jgi:hypothetical protein
VSPEEFNEYMEGNDNFHQFEYMYMEGVSTPARRCKLCGSGSVFVMEQICPKAKLSIHVKLEQPSEKTRGIEL